MAEPRIILDPYISIDGTDVTEYCTKVEINMEAEKVSVDAFGGGGAKRNKQGMRSNTFNFTFLADEDGVIDDLLFLLYDNNEEFAVIVGQAATASTTDPHYKSDRCRMFTHHPMSGEVGQRSENEVEVESQMNIYRVFT